MRERPVDYLVSYPHLALWAWHAGALREAAVTRLAARAERQPEDASAALGRALELRGAMDRVFRAIARAEDPDERDLGLVQREYVDAVENARLTGQGDRYDWSWPDEAEDLARPLWPIALSAFELLTEGGLGRVKECPGAGDCGWLFYDTSRNGTRRWCSMEGCGSRVKMRRLYSRERAARGV